MSGEERGFWARFTFAADVQVTIAESHLEAASAGVRRGVTEVWNFDAHHDCGYRPRVVESLLKVVDCSTWLALYAVALPDGAVHVRYPRWKDKAFDVEPEPEVACDRAFDDGQPFPGGIDRIFICRSGIWTPPWCDDHFDGFVERLGNDINPKRIPRAQRPLNRWQVDPHFLRDARNLALEEQVVGREEATQWNS